MCTEGLNSEGQASHGHFIRSEANAYHGGAIITHGGIEDIPYPRNGMRGDRRDKRRREHESVNGWQSHRHEMSNIFW